MPSRPLPTPVIYAGAETGAPPTVKAYDAETGSLNFERVAYESNFTGGVRVATADFTGDGFPDLVTGPGVGGGPRVRVLDGKTGIPVLSPLGDFFAYEPVFRGGVRVAAGDVNGDGVPDLVTAAGFGGGPRLRVFDGRTGGVLADFMAFDPDFRGGVSVAVADFNRDGKSEIAVGAGAGGGPHVKVYDLASGRLLPGPLGNFFAYEPSFRGGVNVGTDWKAGDITGDQTADLVVGPGAGRPADVKVLDGATGKVVRTIQSSGADAATGVQVATAYVTDDPFADIVVGSGAGAESRVRVFDGLTGRLVPGPVGSFAPFGAGNTQGVNVAASNDPPVDQCECNSPALPYAGDVSFTDAFDTANFNRAVVHQTVTGLGSPASAYRWTYTITNTSLDDPYRTDDLFDQKLARFALAVASAEGLVVEPTPGWSSSVGVNPDGSGGVAWVGGPLDVGQTATFSFTTPPRILCPAYGYVYDAAAEETSMATGLLMAPEKAAAPVVVDLGYDEAGKLLAKLGTKASREQLMQAIAVESLKTALADNTGPNGYVASPAQPGQLVIPATIPQQIAALIRANAAGNSTPDLIGDVRVTPALTADKMVFVEVKAENDNVTTSTNGYQAVKYIEMLRELAILFGAKPGAAGVLNGKTMPGFLLYVTLSDKTGKPNPTPVTIDTNILKLAGANGVFVYQAFVEWDKTACKVRVKLAENKMTAALGPQNVAAFTPDYPPFSGPGQWVTEKRLKEILK